MKSLMNFSDSALSRTEMKMVKGGCAVNTPGGPSGCPNLSSCKQTAQALGVNYCCAHCSTASWCKGCH
jgi:hypothetical protein